MKKTLKRLHEYAKAVSRAVIRQKTAELTHRGFAKHRLPKLKTTAVVVVRKLEPKPAPGKIYDKPKAKVDHTNMVFVKSKNRWVTYTPVACGPTKTALRIRCSQRLNELSPKEKRAAWRHAHNTRPQKSKKSA